MAKMLEISREKIKYHIAVLKENQIVKREGSTKKGSWKILEWFLGRKSDQENDQENFIKVVK